MIVVIGQLCVSRLRFDWDAECHRHRPQIDWFAFQLIDITGSDCSFEIERAAADILMQKNISNSSPLIGFATRPSRSGTTQVAAIVETELGGSDWDWNSWLLRPDIAATFERKFDSSRMF